MFIDPDPGATKLTSIFLSDGLQATTNINPSFFTFWEFQGQYYILMTLTFGKVKFCFLYLMIKSISVGICNIAEIIVE